MKKFQKLSYHNNNTIPLTKSTCTYYECKGNLLLGDNERIARKIIKEQDNKDIKNNLYERVNPFSPKYLTATFPD